MYINDVQVPIQKAKDGTIPRLSPHVVNTYYILIFNLRDSIPRTGNFIMLGMLTCLNSRPFIPMSNDSFDIDPLKLVHFLIGGPMFFTQNPLYPMKARTDSQNGNLYKA